ncbi:hypothetical protein SUGI_0097590 [Cryptomeria japonica]|nr:hypothetical protein SUGI_0097590 [Cryptomeria japonica]
MGTGDENLKGHHPSDSYFRRRHAPQKTLINPVQLFSFTADPVQNTPQKSHKILRPFYGSRYPLTLRTAIKDPLHQPADPSDDFKRPGYLESIQVHVSNQE